MKGFTVESQKMKDEQRLLSFSNTRAEAGRGRLAC